MKLKDSTSDTALMIIAALIATGLMTLIYSGHVNANPLPNELDLDKLCTDIYINKILDVYQGQKKLDNMVVDNTTVYEIQIEELCGKD